MKFVTLLLRENFTLYTLFLMLLSSAFLIFIDRPELKRKNLNKESKFAYISGIVYAVVGIVLYLMCIS